MGTSRLSREAAAHGLALSCCYPFAWRKGSLTQTATFEYEVVLYYRRRNILYKPSRSGKNYAASSALLLPRIH